MVNWDRLLRAVVVVSVLHNLNTFLSVSEILYMLVCSPTGPASQSYSCCQESWSLNRRQNHCLLRSMKVTAVSSTHSLSLCLNLSLSYVHQCTHLKATIITLTMFWCPHISAPMASLISEGGWWAKGSEAKMRERVGNGWLCLMIRTRKD